MENKELQLQLEDINKKLSFIMDEIELQKRYRREMEDLKDDLMRVAKDIYLTSVEELEQVHDYLKTGDILHLFKKILRNINYITQLFEQIESINDFIKDFGPVSKDLINELILKFDELERKGYFSFFKESQKILDNIVTSFKVEDLKAFSDNIVAVLNTVKNLTQPEILNAINNVVNVYNKLDVKMDEDISIFKLIKELNDPETKKALYFGIQFLKSLYSLDSNRNLNIQSLNLIQTNSNK